MYRGGELQTYNPITCLLDSMLLTWESIGSLPEANTGCQLLEQTTKEA